jgi:hypothetical protein
MTKHEFYNTPLTGELDLKDFVNLESLEITDQPELTTLLGLANCPQLINLNLINCPHLQPPFTFLDA